MTRRSRYADAGVAFSEAAHAHGGMVALYDRLARTTEAWAATMPRSTPRDEARRYMLACVDALAAQMREMAEGIMLDDARLPWDGGGE